MNPEWNDILIEIEQQKIRKVQPKVKMKINEFLINFGSLRWCYSMSVFLQSDRIVDEIIDVRTEKTVHFRMASIDYLIRTQDICQLRT